jgi:hypothetical protein
MGVTKMRVVCVALLVVSMVWLYACGGGSKGTGLNIVSGSGGTTGEVVSNKLPGLRVKAIDPTALKVESLLPPPSGYGVGTLPSGYGVGTFLALYGTAITELSLAYGDDDKIAFASYRPGNYEIFLIDPGNPEYLQRSTFIPQSDWYPAWSPDGSKIAFTSYKTGSGDIYIMNPDGSNLQGPIAASSSLEAYPSFSPDGKRLVFVSSRTGNNEIYIYDFGSGSLRQVTSSPSDEIEPKFSRDGTRVIFASNFDGDYEICSVPATATNASSSSFTKLTNNTVADVDPAVNPNPNSLFPFEFVYCSAIGSGGTYEIMGYPDYVRLTENSVHDRFPSVSPSGYGVVFSRYISGKPCLVMGMGGEVLHETLLTEPVSFDLYPCWSGWRTLNRRVLVGPSGTYDQGFAPPFGTSISAAIIGGGGGEYPPSEVKEHEGALAVAIIAQTPGSVKITALPNVMGQDALCVDVEADNILKVLEDNGPGNSPTEWVGSSGQVLPVGEVVIVFDTKYPQYPLIGKYPHVIGVIAPTRGRKLQIAQDGGSVVVRGDLIVAQRLHGRGAPTKRNATEVRLSKGAKGVDIIAK